MDDTKITEYRVRCAAENNSKWGNAFSLTVAAFLFCAGLVIIGVSFWALWDLLCGRGNIFVSVIAILSAALYGTICIAFSVSGMVRLLASYRFTPEGLVVEYPFRQIQTEKWENFREICICYARYSKGVKPATVICFVKKGEKKNWCDRWKTDNPFHYRSVITIDYDDAMLENLRAICPGDVKDLRDTLSYRI